MTLGQLAAIVLKIAAQLAQLLGIAQSLGLRLDSTAQENTPFAIETNTAESQALLSHATYGLSALNDKLDDVLTAINSIRASQSGGDTVILPTTPPAGYGGGSLDPNDVWDATYQTTGRTFADLLASAGFAWELRNIVSTFPIATSPNFHFEAAGMDRLGVIPNLNSQYYPKVNWTGVLATDTIADYLNREEQNYPGEWVLDTDTDTAYADTGRSIGGGSNLIVRCLLSSQDLQRLYGPSITQSVGAPVWPGAANVTLGTPVSIANGASSSEACDGVIVAITAVPADQGSYTFGTDHSYVHLGQLAFLDDSGDYEDGQNLGFASGIITPRRMAHAAGFTLRVKGGVSGTITPWVNA